MGLFYSIWLIIVQEELLCFADPFLFLDLYMLPHLFCGDEAIDVVHEDWVGQLGLESVLKSEIVVVLLEEAYQLHAVDERVILHTRSTHDLVAKAFLAGIATA